MILQKKSLLYYRSQTPSGPGYIPYLSVAYPDTYVLDYQITTGHEYFEVDKTLTYADVPTLSLGWQWDLGIDTESPSKLKLGAFQGSAYNLGGQYGSTGDCTLDATDYTDIRLTRFIQALGAYSTDGFKVELYYTFGDWIKGSLFKQQTKNGGGDWEGAIGTNLALGAGLWDSTMSIITYNLYGLRVYNNRNNLVLLAEYLPVEVGGVPQLYNTVTGNYITKN